MKKLFGGLIFVLIVVWISFSLIPLKNGKLVFVCKENNDLFIAFKNSNINYKRVSSVEDALEMAEVGSGILVLADDYPEHKVVLPDSFFDRAKDKELRVFIEFPDRLPGLKTAEVRKITKERGVITSDVFGDALKKMRIVMIHDCHFIKVDAQDPYLVMAKVAGFDTAIYGLDSTETHPILFEYLEANILVSTTKLSQFVTARYAPKEAWKPIWGMVFNWLSQENEITELDWQETVHPSFEAGDEITEKRKSQAVDRGIEWYYRSGMLVNKLLSGDPNDDIQSIFVPASPVEGYGKNGISECFNSSILHNGSQPISTNRRADCASEASMAIAMRGYITDNSRDKSTAENLQDFVYYNSFLHQGPRADTQSPSFGFVDWYLQDNIDKGIYYGDDNARVILGTITASAALKSNKWDESVVKAVLANFRTTGPAGFKPRRLEEVNLKKMGWEHYKKDVYYHYSPHFQSWLWACYLWLYDKTKYPPLLELSKTGIRNMMNAYPNEWQWTNGLQQERARMILPLAWLLRVDNTTEHREWLDQIVNDLLDFQDDTGAIREEIGNVGHGKYAPPNSNESYGSTEAPLIQENGDPIADMLYTSNFAFFSLTEAAGATGDEKIKNALKKLANFMVRIQVSSEAHPELDGAWYRAFDFKRWEYWASNADAGWGAWSTETGWTQGWIATMLAMHQLKTNIWDFTADSKIENHFETYKNKMLTE